MVEINKFPYSVSSASAVVECSDLAAALEFLTAKVGFRLDAIFPADSPTTAMISGFGTAIRLIENSNAVEPGRIYLNIEANGEALDQLQIPGNVILELNALTALYILPRSVPEFAVSKYKTEAGWICGRAGMEYRDLIPGRYGGRFIASHIRIKEGGPVPDYVHYHKIRFQMIYCLSGWTKLVYEDQGEPFLMQAGDCVLQPPEIRHRVLETSSAFEVVEISSPAIHETLVDHEMRLPNGTLNPNRIFNGQRFVHHIAAKAVWKNTKNLSFRDLGFNNATNGLANVRVLRSTTSQQMTFSDESLEFRFWFVLKGKIEIEEAGSQKHTLGPNDSFTIPSNREITAVIDKNSEVLEVYIAWN